MCDKIKIGCDIYDIIFEDKPVEDAVLCRGFCDTDSRTITLSSKLKDVRLMETFLHECLHAIDDVYRIGLNESTVNVLAVALINLIRDNKINFLK